MENKKLIIEEKESKKPKEKLPSLEECFNKYDIFWMSFNSFDYDRKDPKIVNRIKRHFRDFIKKVFPELMIKMKNQNELNQINSLFQKLGDILPSKYKDFEDKQKTFTLTHNLKEIQKLRNKGVE